MKMKNGALLCVLAGLLWTGCASTGSTCAVAGDVVVAKRDHIEYNREGENARTGSPGTMTRTAIYELIVKKPDGSTKTCKVNPATYQQAKEGEPLK